VNESQKKKFSPLKWYTDSDLEDDELYEIVKRMFHEVDVAITLDIAAGGPAVQVTKNVPLAGRGTQYLMLLGDEKTEQLLFD